ncbi:hypothetical protein LNV23_04390 [Paucibacter sp. DJ1R-11]|uniref:hypothetical protein n=1 Tax=Paucibacter sp. DJ1R-11 TaxID=2893556 RepID=UPI0021E49CE8|nr:hypothetical protein [Paucibacter sp. DJ1R-11]MCV2362687.1 hypothetical protein [Paucibacter sp. DJ1R-11]
MSNKIAFYLTFMSVLALTGCASQPRLFGNSETSPDLASKPIRSIVAITVLTAGSPSTSGSDGKLASMTSLLTFCLTNEIKALGVGIGTAYVSEIDLNGPETIKKQVDRARPSHVMQTTVTKAVTRGYVLERFSFSIEIVDAVGLKPVWKYKGVAEAKTECGAVQPVIERMRLDGVLPRSGSRGGSASQPQVTNSMIQYSGTPLENRRIDTVAAVPGRDAETEYGSDLGNKQHLSRPRIKLGTC